ncbi:MAG: gliding motility-associated C-terminal domain-containing protein [Saprospirales bacterium]|nr:gliding motility-associated C-terminal domain-containing protein [Saprospirales bacterium]
MQNRLHKKLLTAVVFLILSFTIFRLSAQSPTVFLIADTVNTFSLGANCQDTFHFNSPQVGSLIGANIVSPPTGMDPALTGYNIGDLISGEQEIEVAYIVGDDLGNIDTFYFTIYFRDDSPPSFISPLPANLTLNCAEDFPAPLTRQAKDNCLMGILMVPSVDSAVPPTSVCGVPKVINRTWSVSDPYGNSIMQTQIITILPDMTPPVIQQNPVDEVSFCGMTDFDPWLTNQLGTISTHTTDNCDNLTFSYNGPASFPDTCSLSLTIVFYAVDGCGLFDTVSATFTALDTLAPVLIGVPVDTMISCMDTIPAAAMVTVSDNCTNIGPNPYFTEVSTQTMGEGCSDFSYTITRTWEASDSCGNSTIRTQVITVVDTLAPTFTIPPDTAVVCGMATMPANTGEPADLADNCGTNLSLSYVDLIDTLSCPQAQLIRRVWSLVDECENMAVDTQYISVVDTMPPTFTPPLDTVYISCTQVGDASLTGMPTDLLDECDSEPTADYEQEIFDVLCPSSYSIRRVWSVSDACGNIDTAVQIIIVRDTLPPLFAQPAMDMTISCTTDSDAEAAFSAWVADRAGSNAVDNCPAGDLVYIAYNAGTTQNPSLPPPACIDTLPGIYRMQTIDIISIDACGNEGIYTATFTVMDEEPPLIVFCPSDTIVSADTGFCVATLDLLPPIASELCGLEPSPLSYSQTLPVTSQAMPGQELDILIDDLVFTFSVPPAPSQSLGNVDVQFDLNFMDADGAFEYLLIYAEDGTLLGQTVNTPAQCDTSMTFFSIPSQQFNQWAQDGSVTFTLTPNIPPNGLPGRFSVNNICPGGTADAYLSYQADSPLNIRFEYSLNNGPRQSGFFDMPVTEQFELGSTPVAYYVIDCAGNESACTFKVSVQDEEAPALTCPGGFSTATDPGICQAEIELPILAGLQDNCSVGTTISQMVPIDSTEALLTFSYSPDLMDWLSDNKSLSFTGLSPIALGDVTLTIEILGDVDQPGEYFTLFDPFGNNIGTTEVGQPHVQPGDCNTPSMVTFTFPASEFNSWAVSGAATFLAQSNVNIPIPPGGPGDGINPCNPSLVNMDGDNDSTSYLKATLAYITLAPTFSASGATSFPPTVIMDITSPPAITLNQGVTTITYEVTDSYGNMGSCSFDIDVLDTEAPVAICDTTIVYINPSGIVIDTIYVQEIDLGSHDNCELASLFVFPNLITCDAIGDTLTVFLTATDPSGNSSSCPALIRVEGEAPTPSYATGSCGGDTLFLFANPPTSPGSNVFTYHWTGPSFSSSLKNPFIPNATQANAGTYTLTIEGLTGCTATAEIQVTIEDLPLVPALNFGSDSICTVDDIVLITAPVSAGGPVQYLWYSGTPPNGLLVSSTIVPALTIPGPHAEGDSCYYTVVIRDGCESFPSVSKCVHITKPPVALTNDDVINICEGDGFQLGTPVSGPGITYLWEGPGFTSTLQIPPPITNVTQFNDGVYKLTVFRNGCASEPDFTIVNVLNRPDTPQLFNPTTPSNPACQGDSVILLTNITGVTSYQWISPQFNTFVTTVPTLVIENTTIQDHQGNWTLVVNDGFCPSYPSAPIFLYVAPLPNVDASSNSPLCSNQNLLLTANFLSGASYVWTGPTGTTYTGQSHTLPPVPGTYSVTITSSLGCENSSSTSVTVNQAPVITSISNNAIDCPSAPTSVTLTATVSPPNNGTYTFKWTGGPSGNFVSTNYPGIIANATELNNGPYTLVVTDGNGCVSNAATTVVDMGTILPTPTPPTFAGMPPFCEGGSVVLNTIDQFNGNVEIYKWYLPGGGIITTTGPSLQLSNLNPAIDNGNYFVVVEVDGCESDPSPFSVLTINPIPQIAASNNGPVCEGESVELYTTCFTGNVQYSWYKAPNFSSGLCNPVIPDAETNNSGTYTVVVSVNGCTSATASTNVVVLNRPNKPVLAQASPVCLDDPDAKLVLSITPASATQGATYLWYHDGLGLIGGPTSSLILVLNDLSNFPVGVNNFYVIAQFDICQSAPSNPISVTFSEIPSNAANAGPDQDVCEGQVLNLSATPPSVGSGKWTLTGGNPSGVQIANPDMPNTTVTGLEPGVTYTFTWSLSNGACINYSSDNLDVFVDVVEQAFAGNDIDTCEISSILLSATPPSLGGGFWTQPSGQTQLDVLIIDPFNPQSLVTGLVPGNEYRFFWTLPDMGCGLESDTVIITVLDGNANAGVDYQDCSGGCTQLGSDAPDVGYGTWSSPNPDIAFSNIFNPYTEACNLVTGENILIWTLNNGLCGAAGIDTVIVNFTFEPVAEDDFYTVPFAGVIQSNAAENDFKPAGFFVNILSPPSHGVIEMLSNGSFTYRADIRYIGEDFFTYEICADGCACSVGKVHFSIGADAPCDIPTIITPNGDGINDYFVIPCLADPLAFPGNLVAIFNQWGDEVFRGNPYRNNWQGTFAGGDLPAGTYFYIVDFGDGSDRQNGFIIIQR